MVLALSPRRLSKVVVAIDRFLIFVRITIICVFSLFLPKLSMLEYLRNIGECEVSNVILWNVAGNPGFRYVSGVILRHR